MKKMTGATSPISSARLECVRRAFMQHSYQTAEGQTGRQCEAGAFLRLGFLNIRHMRRGVPVAFGVLIEEGEAAFKQDSLGQNRDVFINRLGQHFGQALRNGRAVLPSDFLRLQYLRMDRN